MVAVLRRSPRGSTASSPVIQNGPVVMKMDARPLGTHCSANTSAPLPTPITHMPNSAVNQNSRPRGNATPKRRTATHMMEPEIRYRMPTRAAGGNDSSAMRMARYVVPQKMHTATSAAYARKWERVPIAQGNIRVDRYSHRKPCDRPYHYR